MSLKEKFLGGGDATTAERAAILIMSAAGLRLAISSTVEMATTHEQARQSFRLISAFLSFFFSSLPVLAKSENSETGLLATVDGRLLGSVIS